MDRNQVLNKMFSNKKIRITKSFREYWGKEVGQWFHIQCYNADDTVQICGDATHQIFRNAPISELKP